MLFRSREFAPPQAEIDPKKRESIQEQAKASTQVNQRPRQPSNSQPGRGGSGRGRGSGGRGSQQSKRPAY